MKHRAFLGMAVGLLLIAMVAIPAATTQVTRDLSGGTFFFLFNVSWQYAPLTINLNAFNGIATTFISSTGQYSQLTTISSPAGFNLSQIAKPTGITTTGNFPDNVGDLLMNISGHGTASIWTFSGQGWVSVTLTLDELNELIEQGSISGYIFVDAERGVVVIKDETPAEEEPPPVDELLRQLFPNAPTSCIRAFIRIHKENVLTVAIYGAMDGDSFSERLFWLYALGPFRDAKLFTDKAGEYGNPGDQILALFLGEPPVPSREDELTIDQCLRTYFLEDVMELDEYDPRITSVPINVSVAYLKEGKQNLIVLCEMMKYNPEFIFTDEHGNVKYVGAYLVNLTQAQWWKKLGVDKGYELPADCLLYIDIGMRGPGDKVHMVMPMAVLEDGTFAVGFTLAILFPEIAYQEAPSEADGGR